MTLLINDFHGTEATVRAKPSETVTAATEYRLWHKLCGRKDCGCSGPGGVRGGEWHLEPANGELGNRAMYRVAKRA